DLIIATFDNMSNNIEWAMAEMINEPMIFAKAVHELDLLVGKDRLVQESDLGVVFGTTMTVMLLARLVQGFTWEMPPGGTQVDLKENLQNLWKAKPLFALVRPRLPHHLYEPK
ncbi:valine N-monooxygenase 1-like protein, partial [Tanacetum coccineum]